MAWPNDAVDLPDLAGPFDVMDTHWNAERAVIRAVCQELGLNPKASFADVAARLANLAGRLAALEGAPPPVVADQLVKWSAQDTAAGYLADKLTAGTGIEITPKGDHSGCILNLVQQDQDRLVAVDDLDPTPGYLLEKLLAGANVEITKDAATGKVKITSTASGGGGTRVGSRVYCAASQDLYQAWSDTAWQDVWYDTELYDVGNLFDPGVVPNENGFRVPSSGVYAVSGGVPFPADATGGRRGVRLVQVRFGPSGWTRPLAWLMVPPQQNGKKTWVSVSTVAYIDANDGLKLQYFHDATADPLTVAAGSGPGDLWLAAELVSQ